MLSRKRSRALTGESKRDLDVIYYDADSGVLFSSFKYTGSDFDADMVKMRANPKVRDWWKLMDSFQEVRAWFSSSDRGDEED